MAEKTYLTPKAKEPEFVVSPKGAVNEANGAKIRRKAIKFRPNARRVGQFTTSDPKIQEFLENHEWFKSGNRLVLVQGQHMVAPLKEQPQAQGPRTVGGGVKEEPKSKGKK